MTTPTTPRFGDRDRDRDRDKKDLPGSAGGLRKNEEIRGKTVRVIGPEGEQFGIMLVEQARLKAQQLELDLVEVAPKAQPPVCKIMDFGKHIYEEQKKEQKARKKGHAHELKEVRLKPRIGKHDLEIKMNHAREFLAEGHRVQFTMQYKGREITHMEIGDQILKQVVIGLEECAKVERGPFREGKKMGLILAPKIGAKFDTKPVSLPAITGSSGAVLQATIEKGPPKPIVLPAHIANTLPQSTPLPSAPPPPARR